MMDQIKNSFQHDEDIPIKEEILIRIICKKLAEEDEFISDKEKKKLKIKKSNKSNNFKGKKVILISLFIFFLAIFVGSGFKVLKWYQDNKKTNEQIEEIEEIVEVQEIVEDEETTVELVNEPEAEPESDYWYYIKFPLIEVDFNELVKKNNDTVAWIKVNNTNINYPIVQASDNDYYLTRSYDKKWNDAGWVFMDYRNKNDFSNKNTIIYAHSRLDKTMFGSLSKALKADWYKNKDNHIINISTPNENSLWQIFSVYKIEAESYYITTDFDNDEEYLEFLNTLRSRSKYNFNVSLSSSDSIITLSTCYSDTERTVVHAKKIKKSLRDS